MLLHKHWMSAQYGMITRGTLGVQAINHAHINIICNSIQLSCGMYVENFTRIETLISWIVRIHYFPYGNVLYLQNWIFFAIYLFLTFLIYNSFKK